MLKGVVYFGGYFLATCLLFIFGLSIFKNLGLPLLNNEEAKTAIFAQRILRFGYPKLSDGKNSLYIWEEALLSKKNTIFLPTFPWLKYYFALLGEIPGFFFNDLFLKTALFRLPFTIAGVVGIFIFLKTLLRFLTNRITKLWFFNLFLIFLITSPNIILTLREASSATITILLSSLAFQTLFDYIFFASTSYDNYLKRASLFLFPLFLTSGISYFIILFLFSGLLLFKRKEFSKIKKNLYPFLVSFSLGAPFLLFSYLFKFLYLPPVFVLDNQRELWHNYNWLAEVKNRLSLEFLPLALFIFLLLVIFRLFNLFDNKKEEKTFLATMLLFGYFILEIIIWLSVASLDTSLFIFWQPAYVGFTLLGGLLIFFALQKVNNILIKETAIGLLPAFLLAVFIILLPLKITFLRSHFIQLFKASWGPREYIISYLKKQNNNKEIMIATNFEEMPYIYYLNAQVFTPQNLDKNQSFSFLQAPTAIIPRKQFVSSFFLMNFYKESLEANYYRKIVLPVVDAYYYNSFWQSKNQEAHLLAKKPSEALWLFEKKEVAF